MRVGIHCDRSATAQVHSLVSPNYHDYTTVLSAVADATRLQELFQYTQGATDTDDYSPTARLGHPRSRSKVRIRSAASPMGRRSIQFGDGSLQSRMAMRVAACD